MQSIRITPKIRLILIWLGYAAVPLLLTLLLNFFRANSTTCGILYLTLVVWIATQVGPRLSLFVALISAILFDYYFLFPYKSFTISGLQDWLAMIAYFASCIVVSRVAERARRQTQQAEQRRADVEQLYTLSQEMMLHDDAQGLVRDIPLLIERIFSLDAVLLYVRAPGLSEPAGHAEQDQLYSSLPNTPADMRLVLRRLPGSWEVPPELPNDYVPINLVFGMKSVGALALKPSTLSHEVSTSVAAQVAIALTRATAVEASTRLEAVRSSERLRNALIDSLTHELRTPLTAIRAAATTLLDEDGVAAENLTPEVRTELATIIDEESFRLDTLIGDAIEMAEIDSNSIRVELVPLHTRTTLEQAAEASRTQLAAHYVAIAVEGPDKPVWFDPRLIGRVLRHLLENAARYTPAGTRITLRSRRVADKVEFLVEDEGPGIDAYDLPLIFEKFYRGQRGISAAKGSGMGLAITRAILAAHGGSIDVQSTPGKGTTFRLQIPAIEKAPLARPF
ncbi:sensor histidine kinase [Acidicapsa ligni]|uniref:sensor histidine kinase n=1 Tax=Acidicapsa ligni TaxID=542300 RepID=UPI0021E0E37F|nr:ATP-binding protein [Acidicapsa ligni]